MNLYLLIVLIALIAEYLVRNAVRYLNLRALDPHLPSEFEGFYDAVKYRQSQEYTRVHTRFAIVSSTIERIVLIGFIFFGGFQYLDTFVRGFGLPQVPTGLLFFACLFIAQDVFSIPFDLYEQFVIEARFGFNRMTLRTFVLDRIKAYLIAIVLGAILGGSILYFFEETGRMGWLYAWGVSSLFIFIAQPLFTTVIAPMFNKFTPLEEGELRQAIECYAERVGFPIGDICVMDGSRRSAHSNAYFSGLGKKRIALYDTLIEQHTLPEMVAILAHEVGHYMRKHLRKGMVLSMLHIGILLFLFSLLLENREFYAAFGLDQPSVYAGLVFFGILYTPLELLLSVGFNALSRKYEYEADMFAADTLGEAEPLILGLKKLAVSNLGNLTPHRLAVIFNYTHPPILQRIERLRRCHAPGENDRPA